MISGTTDRWQRLGALLIQRRTALSPRFHNRGAFCEATGLKYRLVYDIEEARRTNFGTSTLAAIEAAYQLAPGTIARVLSGGDLDITPAPRRLDNAPPRRLPPVSPEMTAAMHLRVELIKELVEDAKRAHPGERLTAAMIFPRSESAAAWWWDRLLTDNWAPGDMPSAVAAMVTLDEEEARLEQENPGYATG